MLLLIKLALSPGSLWTKLNAINNLTDNTTKLTWASDEGPLHLNSTLIAPSNVVERIVMMLDCPSKLLALVCLPYQLTIGAASEGPSQSC